MSNAKIDIAFFRRDRALSIEGSTEGVIIRMGVKADGWRWVTVRLSNQELLYLAEALHDLKERLREEGVLFKDTRRNDSNDNSGGGGGGRGGGF